MANALAGLLIIGELLIIIGVYRAKNASVLILASISPIINGTVVMRWALRFPSNGRVQGEIYWIYIVAK
jgi:ABC-type cobalamin transport system permease subunit